MSDMLTGVFTEYLPPTLCASLLSRVQFAAVIAIGVVSGLTSGGRGRSKGCILCESVDPNVELPVLEPTEGCEA